MAFVELPLMDMKAAAPKGSTQNFFDCCGTLNLKATQSHEAAWMAAIARMLVYGGTMTITTPDKPPVVVVYGEFQSVESTEPAAPAT